MAKSTNLSDHEEVNAYIKKLDADISETIEYIRQIILKTDNEIGEKIKWNNPCFYFTGEMQPFDPKEYKRDLIVMNLYKGRIMLVFPSGAKINDATGLLEGNYKDGRKIVLFKDLDDVKSKQNILQNAIKEWLRLVDK